MECSGHRTEAFGWSLYQQIHRIWFLVVGKEDSSMVGQYLIESTHLVDLIAGQLTNAIFRVRLNQRLSDTTLEIVRALTKALEYAISIAVFIASTWPTYPTG